MQAKYAPHQKEPVGQVVLPTDHVLLHASIDDERAHLERQRLLHRLCQHRGMSRG